jgi:peptidyl-prolyl cis-trans isomerase D
VIQAEEVVPAKKIPFEEARTQIARELLARDRARKLADDRARAALAAVQGGKKLQDLFPKPDEAAAKKAKPATFGGRAIAWDETGSFPAAGAGYLPRLGPVPDLARDAMAAQAGQVLPRVYDTPQGPVVAVVKLREKPDPAAFEAQKDRFTENARMQAFRTRLDAWLKDLRTRAKVQVNEPFVQGAAAAAD